MPALLRANQLDSSVGTLSGILEEARESAISGNTFVWVAFTDPPASSPVSGTWVATFQSQDGTESAVNTGTPTAPSWTTTLTVPSSSLIIHNKLQNLPGVAVVSFATLTSANSTLTAKDPAVTPQDLQGAGASPATPLHWTMTSLSSTGMPANTYFTKAIEFTPDGQAHVQTWNSNIVFGLEASVGAAATVSKNCVLFNISRLTGKTTVYRL